MPEITLSNFALDENPEAGHVIGSLNITGGLDGETFTFTLADSIENRFEIVANAAGGFNLAVKNGGDLFNFEDPHRDDFLISISAAGNKGTNVAPMALVIRVDDANDAPVGILVSGGTVLETATAGTRVATLDPDDQDVSEPDDFQFVTDGTGNTAATSDLFVIDQYDIRLKAAPAPEQVGSHELWVKFTDQGGLSVVKKITLNVDKNDAPTDVILSKATVAENAAAGTEVGRLSALDPDLSLDDTFGFRLTNDADGRFAVSGDKLVIKDGSKLDFEAASSHQVTVLAQDSGGKSFEKKLTVNLTDVDKETFAGTSKNDKLVGTAGNDILNGKAGKDILTGGKGKDTFVFDTPVKKGQFDQITDFNSADDTLQFSLSALKSVKVKGFKKGKMNKKFFSLDKSKDKDDYLVYNKKKGIVSLDTDGVGAKKGIEILKLKPGTKLAADDFLFI